MFYAFAIIVVALNYAAVFVLVGFHRAFWGVLLCSSAVTSSVSCIVPASLPSQTLVNGSPYHGQDGVLGRSPELVC